MPAARPAAACSLLVLILGACAAAPERVRRLDGTRLGPAQVDGVVTRLMEAGRVPGLGLAIVDGDRIVHLKAYGLRDVEAKEPLTTGTVMYGASLTKAAFAYMVMTLVEEGRIDLDRPIGSYLQRPLPDYEKYRDLTGDPRWQRLTPRMLLSHTSGFPNWRWFNDDERLDIKFEPGARYAYSGEGIRLLQFVMEEGIGLPVGTLMQSRVFDRFGMHRTAMTWRDDFAPDVALGHDEQGRPIGHDRRDEVDAAGSMDTTVADYARFLAGVLRGDGLGESARREMLSPQVAIHSTQQFPTTAKGTTSDNRGIELAYGLGWGLFTSPHGRAYFKEGHDDGWNNYAVTFEERRIALLLMANSSNGESIFKYLVDALLGETCMPWFWEGYVPYDRPELRLAEALEQPHPPCAPIP